MLFMKKGISDSRMSRCMPEPLERRVLMAAGTPVTLQFEDYPIPGGAVVARDNAGYTGRGYVDYTADNGLVEIPINGVPETGMYELTFRYANGSSSTRPLNVHSSVRPINPRLAFAPTGSWTKWGTVTVQAQLNAGDNEVSLAALGQNGPNLDSLTYRTLPSPLPDARLIALDEALQRLAALDARHARVVELRYFGGLSVEEVAEALAVSAGTVKRDWRTARAWLFNEMRGPGTT